MAESLCYVAEPIRATTARLLCTKNHALHAYAFSSALFPAGTVVQRFLVLTYALLVTRIGAFVGCLEKERHLGNEAKTHAMFFLFVATVSLNICVTGQPKC